MAGRLAQVQTDVDVLYREVRQEQVVRKNNVALSDFETWVSFGTGTGWLVSERFISTGFKICSVHVTVFFYTKNQDM